MARYAPYTTTVIGAHSVPRWYEALDRLVSSAQLSDGDFAAAQLRAMQAAILEQESAGIDVITGGEMHRRRHNLHSPPNAMLNHFWAMIPSFRGEIRGAHPALTAGASAPYPRACHSASRCGIATTSRSAGSWPHRRASRSGTPRSTPQLQTIPTSASRCATAFW